MPTLEAGEALAEALRFLSGDARTAAVRWLRRCSPLARRMHRNTRATLRRYHELGLLDSPPPQRVPREVVFDFAMVEEREVYDAVTSYIDRRFDELENEKPGKGFVMTIYRRRAASSPYALRSSLERRTTGLKAVIAQLAPDPSILGIEDAQELEDLLDVDVTAALPDSPDVARRELAEVESLIGQIDGLGGLDSKRDRLITELKSLLADGRAALVFTGYTDTMVYLRDHLVTAFGATVASYSGKEAPFARAASGAPSRRAR